MGRREHRHAQARPDSYTQTEHCQHGRDGVFFDDLASLLRDRFGGMSHLPHHAFRFVLTEVAIEMLR